MRILSVVHDPSSLGGGGLFEAIAGQRGERLDRWHVPDGPPPAPPEAYDAIMVFGGVQHPDQDDEYRWIPAEVGYIGGALEQRVPMIGVCLGSQLVARAAGAWVGRAERSEVGWHELELTREGREDAVVGVLPERIEAFQWHYYTFALPDDAVQLATSAACRQAYRLGDRTWGIQFHAEVTRQMIDRWLVEGESELEQPLDTVRTAVDANLGAWNAAGRRLCGAFLDVAEQLR